MKTKQYQNKKIMAGFLLALTGACILLASGCKQPMVFASVETFTKQMNVINTNVTDLKAAQGKLETNYTALVHRINEGEQQVADNVDRARTFNFQNTCTNPFTMLVAKELTSAANSLPNPSAETKAIAEQRLAWERSTNLADRLALQAAYDQERSNAIALRAQKEELARTIETNKIELAGKTLALFTNTDKLQQITVAANATNEIARARTKELIEQKHAATLDHVMFIFLLLGGLTLVGTGVACYLHVPGVLIPGGIAGVILLGLGFAIRVVGKLIDQTWFMVTAGALMVGVGGVIVWFVYRSFQTRQTHALNAEFLDKTSAAIEEMKLRDEENNTDNYKHLRPFLEKWHRTQEGTPNYLLHQHIDSSLKKHHHLRRAKKPRNETTHQAVKGEKGKDGGAASVAAPI